MGRLLFSGLGGLTGMVLLVLWIWAILDVISTDEAMMRNLPKIVWLLLVVSLPTIGAVAWIAVGRPEGVGWRPGSTAYQRPVRRTIGPEDRPGWNRSREEQRREFEETDRRLREERERRRGEVLGRLSEKDLRAHQLREWEADLLRREKEMLERRQPEGPETGAAPG